MFFGRVTTTITEKNRRAAAPALHGPVHSPLGLYSRSTYHPALDSLRASRSRTAPVIPGSIPERQFEGTYWSHALDLLFKLTGAQTYTELKAGLTIIYGRNHRPGEVPIFYAKQTVLKRGSIVNGVKLKKRTVVSGVPCEGHSGGNNPHWALKFRYRKADGKMLVFYLGVDCAVHIPCIPDKLPTSAKVRALRSELSQLEENFADLQKQSKRRPSDSSLTARLETAYDELVLKRTQLHRLWIRENREKVKALNAEEFKKRGTRLREQLNSILIRAEKLYSRGAEKALAVKNLRDRLIRLESLAEGVSTHDIYLHDHIVAQFRAVFEWMRSISRSLLHWPSVDMAMRTFERYVGTQGEPEDELFQPDEVATIRRCLQTWREEVNNPGEEKLTIAELDQLKRFYNRFLDRGYLSRRAVASEDPNLATRLAAIKEDLAIFPDEMQGVATAAQELLDAWGPREVMRRHTPVERAPREKPERPATIPGSSAEPAHAADVPGFSARPLIGAGQMVGRLSEALLRDGKAALHFWESDYVSYADIRREFPEINEWIAQLEKDGPSIDEGIAPKCIGRLITSEAQWDTLKRKIAQWRDHERREKFPRFAAQKFQELATRKRLKRGVRFDSIAGLRVWTERLGFDKSTRKSWPIFIAKHQAALSETVRARYQDVLQAFVGFHDQVTSGRRALEDYKRETLTLAQIEAIGALDRALAAEYQKTSSLSDGERGGLTILLGARTPLDGMKADEWERARFLFARGYVERESTLRDEVRRRDFRAATVYETLVTRVEARVTQPKGRTTPLGPSLRTQVDRALAAKKDNNVLTADQIALLREVDQALDSDHPTPEGKWTIYRSYFDLPRDSWNRADLDHLARFIQMQCSDADRRFLARRIQEEWAGSQQDLVRITHVLWRLSELQAVMSPGQRMELDEALLASWVEGSHEIRFGFDPQGSIPQRIERGKIGVAYLGVLARFIPQGSAIRRQILDQLILALGETLTQRVYADTSRSFQRVEVVRQASIAELSGILLADPSWRPIMEETLNAGANHPSDGVSKRFEAVRKGCEMALAALRLSKHPLTPPAPPAPEAEQLRRIAFFFDRVTPVNEVNQTALPFVTQLEEIATQALARQDETLLRQVAMRLTDALAVLPELGSKRHDFTVRNAAQETMQRILNRNHRLLYPIFQEVLSRGAESLSAKKKYGCLDTLRFLGIPYKSGT